MSSDRAALLHANLNASCPSFVSNLSPHEVLRVVERFDHLPVSSERKLATIRALRDASQKKAGP